MYTCKHGKHEPLESRAVCKIFTAIVYAVLARKHHLHKLTHNPVPNKTCQIIKQYQLGSSEKFSINTTKMKNTMYQNCKNLWYYTSHKKQEEKLKSTAQFDITINYCWYSQWFQDTVSTSHYSWHLQIKLPPDPMEEFITKLHY